MVYPNVDECIIHTLYYCTYTLEHHQSITVKPYMYSLCVYPLDGINCNYLGNMYYINPLVRVQQAFSRLSSMSTLNAKYSNITRLYLVFCTRHLQMINIQEPLFQNRTGRQKGVSKGADETHLYVKWIFKIFYGLSGSTT